MKNLIGITIGDPKGIGPEITAKALSRLATDVRNRVRVYAPSFILNDIMDGNVRAYDMSDEEAGEIAMAALDEAIADAYSGKIGAITTAPVNKARMQYVIPNFCGHTEYISRKLGANEPTMVFIGERDTKNPFIISIVTRHVALSDVGKSINHESIATTIERTDEAAKRYLRNERPKIAVLALNPHAGENGSFGFEEKEFIEPVVRKLKSEGVDCSGPFPGDSIISEDYDAFVAMYHDQGMIPVKLLCGTSCVNTTIGLPFIRTSPGHGTAENIAGKGIADESGLLAAIGVADRLLKTNEEQTNRGDK